MKFLYLQIAQVLCAFAESQFDAPCPLPLAQRSAHISMETLTTRRENEEEESDQVSENEVDVAERKKEEGQEEKEEEEEASEEDARKRIKLSWANYRRRAASNSKARRTAANYLQRNLLPRRFRAP